jgi:hypothetical protein
LFEPADAVLCGDEPVRSLVALSLVSGERCGHGGLYRQVAVPFDSGFPQFEASTATPTQCCWRRGKAAYGREQAQDPPVCAAEKKVTVARGWAQASTDRSARVLHLRRSLVTQH